MLNNEFSINLATCAVHINFTSDGLVCDICTLSGQRMVGTWISTEEINAGKVQASVACDADGFDKNNVSNS